MTYLLSVSRVAQSVERKTLTTKTHLVVKGSSPFLGESFGTAWQSECVQDARVLANLPGAVHKGSLSWVPALVSEWRHMMQVKLCVLIASVQHTSPTAALMLQLGIWQPFLEAVFVVVAVVGFHDAGLE